MLNEMESSYFQTFKTFFGVFHANIGKSFLANIGVKRTQKFCLVWHLPKTF